MLNEMTKLQGEEFYPPSNLNEHFGDLSIYDEAEDGQEEALREHCWHFKGAGFPGPNPYEGGVIFSYADLRRDEEKRQKDETLDLWVL